MIKRSGLAISIILAIATWVGVAHADPAYLTSIRDHVKGPVQLALDQQGNLYVSQSSGNVAIYDHNGNYMKALSVKYPLGLAVDAGGNIYVCYSRTSTTKGIDVFNPNLTFSHTFIPNISTQSITINGDGNIYVVDTANNVVRLYDPAGNVLQSIGSAGSSDGHFNSPVSVTFSETLGEVYVADMQLQTGDVSGSRIQVFNRNGEFLRSFSKYGVNAGDITGPAAMAVDSAGRLYLVDTYQAQVHILNSQYPAGTSWTWYGTLYSTVKPLVIPIGVAVAKNGLVYVTSNFDSSIDVYALDGYVTMDENPSSLSFSARQFSPNPAAQALAVSNRGSAAVGWTVATDQSWIIPNITSGMTNAGSTNNDLSVGVNMDGLPAGVYTGNVTIAADFGRTDSVPVSLTVLPPPVLSLDGVDPNGLILTTKKGTNPDPQPINVNIANVDSLSWTTVSSAPAWLKLDPSSGNTSASARVMVTSQSMAAGSYDGVITFNAQGAVGDGSPVKVFLTIKPSTKIVVASNIGGAAFKIDGPVTYYGSGQNWSTEDVSPGTYTITYTSVAGYVKPKAQTLTLGDSGELDFSGVYIEDNQPPVMTLSTLIDGSYTNNAVLNIAGIATDNIAVDTVTVNNGPAAINVDDGSFSQAVMLVAGLNTITTTALDTAGNATTDVRTIILDQTLPVITLSNPADNSVTNLASPTFAGTVDKFVTVSVQVQGETSQLASMQIMGSAQSPAAVTVMGNAFSLPVDLPYGQNTVLVTATDLAGNVSSVKRTVIFDNVKPTLAITNPAQDITTNQPGLLLQGTVADLTNIKMSIAVDDGTAKEVLQANGTFEQQLAFDPEKSYKVKVTATDEAGNATEIERNIIYKKTTTVLTVGTKPVAQGRSATLSAVLSLKTEGTDTPKLSGQTITFTLGSQSCPGTTDEKGNASCAISPVNSPLGQDTPVTAVFAGNPELEQSSDSRKITVFAFLNAGSSFVMGDGKTANNAPPTFWGAQWSKNNAVSTGEASSSFKGFADVAPADCGAALKWSAGSGNSATPPAGVPAYMAVIVSSSMTKSGSASSGNVSKIVILKTDTYDPSTSSSGTGTIVDVYCQN